VLATEPFGQWRQLLAVDRAGASAVHSGTEALGVVAEHIGPGVAAAGNLLATPRVPARMVEAWSAATGSLEERLLAALVAAVAEGGEAGPVHSCGLSVVDGSGWRVTDLRVDWSDDPVGDLAALVARWLPQRADYVARALDPRAAPSYGVPGDG
jgi:uncharacterized Ntn-hydrolase superfamily protein